MRYYPIVVSPPLLDQDTGLHYTRHWMPSGVTWNPEHTDITNHYLQQGVAGGLPLMFLFIAVLFKGFSFVVRTVWQDGDLPQEYRFMIWVLGTSLFSLAVTFTSVSYYDQSFLFIYLTLAAIGSVASITPSRNLVATASFETSNSKYLDTL